MHTSLQPSETDTIETQVGIYQVLLKKAQQDELHYAEKAGHCDVS
jgi:hypothetical protein